MSEIVPDLVSTIIPVYNRRWHNYYPNARRYHQGHHFILDVF